MKKIILFLFMVTGNMINAQQPDNPLATDLIAFNGFSFKKGDSVLTRGAFGKEVYQSTGAIKFLKKGRLNEGLTLLFALGGILSLVHTDLDYIYTRKEQTRRQIFNLSGLVLMGTSAFTMKYYLRNMGKAVNTRNQDLLLTR